MGGGAHGGAAKGALSLCEAERKMGIDSRVLIELEREGKSGTEHLTASRNGRLGQLRSELVARVSQLPTKLYRRKHTSLFSTGLLGGNWTRLNTFRNADLIHLHWTVGLVSLDDLRHLDKPTVWTLRDMWPMTGGCHYSLGCVRYQTTCGACPQLGSTRETDLSHALFRLKQKWMPDQVHVVGISNWITDCARSSAIFSGSAVQTIHNGIDTSLFFPEDKRAARTSFGLPKDKKIVLLGALNVRDFYKGFDLFAEAWDMLDRSHVHLAVFGKESEKVAAQLGPRATSLSLLKDSSELRRAYSSADVFVAPSTEEAFGKTLAEAQACGLPVVCFDATGPRDIVENGVTGVKALAFQTQSMAQGIQSVLGLPASEYLAMQKAARVRAVSLFDINVAARKYRNLYESILSTY